MSQLQALEAQLAAMEQFLEAGAAEAAAAAIDTLVATLKATPRAEITDAVRVRFERCSALATQLHAQLNQAMKNHAVQTRAATAYGAK